MIDSHVHVWSQDTLRYPFGPHDTLPAPGTTFSASEFLDDAKGCDVHGFLLIQPRIYGYDHAHIFDVAAKLEGRALVMPLINVNRSSSVTELREVARKELTAAVRVIALGEQPAEWLCSPQASRVWATASELHLPVGLLIDPPQLPLVNLMAETHPGLTIVIDHMGRCAPGLQEQWGDALLGLGRYPNVYVKLSAIGALSKVAFPYVDMWSLIGSLYETYGPSRLLWGSDWPHARNYGRYDCSHTAVQQALSGISGVDRLAIFGGTAAQIFRFNSAIQDVESLSEG